ncbi:O-antigen translocase [Roseateles sp. L2-2]|uniref:O-antigen translocase n=1 Tax=Roseateles sp. L2-2 TaxID=3422597 RepID=UPI003D36E65C
MTLIKTSLLNGIAVATKVACALVLNKILALYVGPSGYAVIGQFQNAVAIAGNLVGNALSPGVTKATAEHFDAPARQHAVWQTALRLSLVACLLVALPILAGGADLVRWLLHRDDLSTIYLWIAASLPALALNNLLLAIANGKKEVRTYVGANIATSLVSLLVTGGLTHVFGLYGTLAASSIGAVLSLGVTAWLITRHGWFRFAHLWGRLDRGAGRELTGFALMGLTSAVALPMSQILIRDILVSHTGLATAGLWQASTKISELYLMLITTTLAVYYLPRIAEIRTGAELRREVFKVYRLVLPVTIAGALVIFLLRDFIVQVLFAADFAPMRALFPWQLTGDVIKIGSWVLGYIMLGRAMVRVFILTEILFSASLVTLSWCLVRQYGVIGAPMGYALNYALYWIAMALFVRKEISRLPPEQREAT